jgi:enoyl-CoA hydratase
VEKSFVAGADIAEFAQFLVEEGAQPLAQGQEIFFNFVENLKIP